MVINKVGIRFGGLSLLRWGRGILKRVSIKASNNYKNELKKWK